jgi:regulatory protein
VSERRQPKAEGRKPKAEPLDLALRLLAARSRTEAELLRALAARSIPEADRASAVARLRELGYMDDAAVASGRARTLLSQGAAPRLVQQRLLAQGVEAAVARQAAEEAAEGQGERELLEKALERRMRGRAPRDDKERRRLFRALVGKGHRPSLVARVLGLNDGEVQDDAVGTDDAG